MLELVMFCYYIFSCYEDDAENSPEMHLEEALEGAAVGPANGDANPGGASGVGAGLYSRDTPTSLLSS